MAFEVKKAKRQRRPLKVALEGLSGAGKTTSAIRMAFALVRAGIGKRLVVADSENESASLCEGMVHDGQRWDFETCCIPPEERNPAGYTKLYKFLIAEGYDVIVLDSLTHAWKGALSRVDQIAASSNRGSFNAWSVITPEQEEMVTTLTDGRAHLITTMRVKSEYETEKDDRGKTQVKKLGLKADQRDNLDYEFDCVVRIDDQQNAQVVKVRGCDPMLHRRANKPGPDFWKPLFDWWLSAEAPFDAHAAAIRKAATLDALKAAYTAAYGERGRLTDRENAELDALKDRRKAELSPTPATDKPAPCTRPVSNETGIDDLRDVLEAAILEAGTDFASLMRRHGPAVCKWDDAKEQMPTLEQLTWEEATAILELVRNKPQPAGAK